MVKRYKRNTGYNNEGNYYRTAGGSNRREGHSYHYSNNDGSYYYRNDNGSTYHEDSYGNYTYTRGNQRSNRNYSNRHYDSDDS